MRLHGLAKTTCVCLLIAFCAPSSMLTFAQVNVSEPSKSGQQIGVAELATELARLSDLVFAQSKEQSLASELPDYVRRSQQRCNQASSEAWSAIHTRQDWQRFRDEKLAQLRHSHGSPSFPNGQLPNAQPAIEVRRRHEDAAGRFVIENVIYQSRPNVWVTANLYRPAMAVSGAPGIVISHAHHTPKEHAELQAMGMTWARAGCYVLIPDHFGHGERRQHPFVSADSFLASFRVSRQDYYFRYDTGIKLHLLGESLMSWLASDLSRAVDCLLQQPGIDGTKIILLGSVAGGGDPCAVAAALDDRIAAAVPFNFGGPQPETPFPLPADAQTSFNFAGSGSWESTRNLAKSTTDGFLPWVIVGSLAPRRLLYAHEFRWDQDHDPVWQRLQTIYQLYDRPDHLAFTHGRGELRGQTPEATHCTHIGAFHRQRMHQAFRRWFQIDVSPSDEIFEPLPADALHCLSDIANSQTKPTLVDFESLARERVAGVRAALPLQPIVVRRQQLKGLWMQVLGQEGPMREAQAPSTTNSITNSITNSVIPRVDKRHAIASPSLRVESLRLCSVDGLHIPIVLLLPAEADTSKKWPLVLYVQTSGAAQQLKSQAQDLGRLLAAGQAVCLFDMRGTGQSWSDSGRGRTSASTSISSSLLMLGDPLMAGQLRDLRSVWAWLRDRPDIDTQRMKVWGDSRRPVVTAEADRVVPRDDDALLAPAAEPSACLLALLLSLYEDSVHSLCLSGGLNNFCSALGPMQIRLPHDCVLPGLFRAGDIEELIVQAAERFPVRCERLVDGRNRLMSQDAIDEYQSQLKRLSPSDAELMLTISRDSQAIEWLH